MAAGFNIDHLDCTVFLPETKSVLTAILVMLDKLVHVLPTVDTATAEATAALQAQGRLPSVLGV